MLLCRRLLSVGSTASLRHSRLPQRNTYGLLSSHLRRGFAKRPEDFIQNNQTEGSGRGGPEGPERKSENNPMLGDNPMGGDENSFYDQKKSSMYIFMGAGVTLVGLYFIMMVNSSSKQKSKKNSVSHVGRAHIGGPWKLWTMDGQPFGSGDLDGKYYLIYFGFCRCPDVCPQSLFKLTKALGMVRNAPESKYFDLETIFVTVDPDRDDKEAVEKFLKHFDKRIIPVTGKSNDDPNLRNMMAKFKIYANKIELEEEEKDPSRTTPYTLDHTIITYLMDDENRYLTHLGSNLSSAEIAQLIITKVNENQREKLLR